MYSVLRLKDSPMWLKKCKSNSQLISGVCSCKPTLWCEPPYYYYGEMLDKSPNEMLSKLHAPAGLCNTEFSASLDQRARNGSGQEATSAGGLHRSSSGAPHVILVPDSLYVRCAGRPSV